MTWIVTWALDTQAELERIAVTRSDPAGVDRAVVFTDYILRRYPLDMGESRTPGFRVWYGDVLGVYYRVDDVGMRVEVIAVGPSRRR